MLQKYNPEETAKKVRELTKKEKFEGNIRMSSQKGKNNQIIFPSVYSLEKKRTIQGKPQDLANFYPTSNFRYSIKKKPNKKINLIYKSTITIPIILIGSFAYNLYFNTPSLEEIQEAFDKSRSLIEKVSSKNTKSLEEKTKDNLKLKIKNNKKDYEPKISNPDEYLKKRIKEIQNKINPQSK